LLETERETERERDIGKTNGERINGNCSQYSVSVTGNKLLMLSEF